ncbi:MULTISPECIES: hypothetical protein [Oceanobacillus]|uniref:hypothetical protein n=1 Tax=Oceanobacillus TaxID=182709 RepID=UPI000BA74140|nr:hypothetical protein [Oceanobacillus sp.]MCM3398161.1 hypothetical protein [Oceanobacillus profundus]PAE29229.1 hypothetical protein CHI07_10150 [Paenibacillus sp. 7884-2]
MVILQLTIRFLLLLTIPVLYVLYVGLMLCALLILLAGILRTFGIEQIQMSIWQGIELPAVLSIPISLAVSILLVICSLYVRRSIRYCIVRIRI